MPEITPDTTLTEALEGIVQNNPGAMEVINSLRACQTKRDFINIISFLYERGPRGPALWSDFQNCNEDAIILGKDLIAKIQEWDEESWEI